MPTTPYKQNDITGQIFLITGERGSGKTGLCREISNRARQAGWDVAGLISPAVHTSGRKTGIEAVDLRTGQQLLLATPRQVNSPDNGLHTIGWAFDEDVTRWGDSVLANAVPCDLLVVDELGPLELERHQGWTAGLDVVTGSLYRAALVVVRPDLLDTALARWPESTIVDVEQGDALDHLMSVLGLNWRPLVHP
jgi:nucleoside-triphosphatase THEP1